MQEERQGAGWRGCLACPIPRPPVLPLLLGFTAGPGLHVTQVRSPWLCQHQVTFLYIYERMEDITY